MPVSSFFSFSLHISIIFRNKLSTGAGVFPYYDLDAAAWRSFRLDLFIGYKLVFTHRQSDGKGHGHAYLRSKESYKRSTPVSDKEIAARSLFQNRAQLVKQLMTERRCKTKAEAWRIAKEQIK